MRLSILILLLFSMLSLLAKPGSSFPKVEKGILDLHDIDDEIPYLSLQGEWEFYWKQLLGPKDFSSAATSQTIYGKVPAYWTQYKDEIPDVKGCGYATYRLRIFLPTGKGDTLSLHIPVFDSSYELYLNGKRKASNGIVSSKESSAKPGYEPVNLYFLQESDTLELIIQVANYDHRQGGFWKNMYFGPYESMRLRAERKKFAVHSSSGILLFFALFFFILSMLGKRDRMMLFFSLSVFGMFLRSIATVYFPIGYFFNIPWTWYIRIEYLGTYLAMVFGLLYLNRLFPSALIRKLTIINTLLFTGLCIFVLLSNVRSFSYSIFVFEALIVVFLAYYMIRSLRGLLKRKTTESIFFITFLVFLAVVINDILIALSSSAVSEDYLTTVAFLLFILAQAILLINQWLSDYRAKTMLSKELESINRNLEEMIEARTTELKRKNYRLDAALSMKNKLFSIIAHDLKSPVASLAQYSDILLKEEGNVTDKKVFTELNQLAYTTMDLVDNLLYWGMSQRGAIRYDPGQQHIEKTIEELLEIFDLQVRNKKLLVTLEVDGNLSAWCDAVLLKIILRNLISNAIKFSYPSGSIQIKGRKTDKWCEISIEDQGLGMSTEQVDLIQKKKIMESTRGTANEKGTGLGLQLSKELVELNKGSLYIKSKPGKGTAITFTLPGNHEI